MTKKNIPDIRIGDLVEYDTDAAPDESFKEDFETYNTRDGPFLVYDIVSQYRDIVCQSSSPGRDGVRYAAASPRIFIHFLEQKTGNYESDYIQYFKVLVR